MMQIFFLLIILCFRVIQKIAGKAISNEMPKDFAGLASYNSISMGISAGFAALLLLFSFSRREVITFPMLGWVIACATGAAICISSVCSLLAMHNSSIVLGSLFGMAGLLIPTIYGIFLFGQNVAPLQWVGIFLLFISALLQVLFKSYVPKGSVLIYSFLQFAITAAVLFGIALFLSAKQKRSFFLPNKKLMAFTVLSAIALFGISQFSTMASAVIPTAILFPVSDGGGMVIAALVADIIYKEKLTTKSTFGIILGITAIVLIKLFAAAS